MTRAPRWKLLSSCLLALVTGLAGKQADAADSVPDDARLGAARGALQSTVDHAAAAGLPTRPLVVKVREGLAKGAAPERIVATVESLGRGLDEGCRFARAHGRNAPSPALIEALADLHTRGVGWDSATPLFTTHVDDAALARAVDVLADLAERGYPERRAGLLLRDVENRDPAAIGRVAAGLESIRRGLTVSRADALDSLGANLAVAGAALDTAVDKSLEGRDHGLGSGNGRGSGQGSEHAGAASKKGMAKGLK